MRAYFAKVLYDGKGVRRNAYVLVEGEKIVKVSDSKPECEIVEGEVITPAFIDAHSHVGMDRQGEPVKEGEANDKLSQILPEIDSINGVYFDDKAFEEAIEHGVLYSIVVPGSGNVLGGKAWLVRNFAKNRDEAGIRRIGYKMALGYNPRSTENWKGERPSTRMGVYAMLESEFERMRRKIREFEIDLKRKERELRKKVENGEMSEEEAKEELEEEREKFRLSLGLKEEHLADILSGKALVKTHVHKEDDALYLIHLKNRFGINCTAEHLLDVHRREIFEKLKQAKIPATYGPLDAFAYKVELKHESYKNVKHLMASGLDFCLMSDHPATLARDLFLQLRHFLRYGMSEAWAISLITSKPAEIHGIEELGSVESGKLASFVVWSGDPFDLRSRITAVVAEGKYMEIEP